MKVPQTHRHVLLHQLWVPWVKALHCQVRPGQRNLQGEVMDLGKRVWSKA